MLHLLFFLLPIAAATGWYAGYRQRDTEHRFSSAETANIIPEYLTGLNYLINEEPDKAIDVFVKMLEVNDDTIETHLALGGLFRRRGEIERAIRIHQNLIARPQLSIEQRAKALSELGQDYLRAGVLDRAENLFLELLKIDIDFKESYHYLLNIYQIKKDWKAAIALARKIAKATDQDFSMQVANYYCELAEKSFTELDVSMADGYLKKALAINKKCVRASLLLGKISLAQMQYKLAISYYLQVENQDADYMRETLVPLSECYLKLNRSKDYIKYLKESLKKHYHIDIMLALVDQIKATNKSEAMNLLVQNLQEHLSLRGISYFLNNESNFDAAKIELVQQYVSNILNTMPNYRCVYCGFASKLLYWQCPSCRHFATIKPITAIN